MHAPPQHKNAYRRWFETLHPSMQLVFMQLWMPVFLCVMFILCYVASFQHVAPRHVPVGIVGSAEAAGGYQDATDAAMPGAFDFSMVKDEATADAEVRSGERGAVYVVESNQLIIASAHQAQAASLLPKLLDPVLNADETPEIKDVAPLPAGDMGMTPMYLMLAWCISGYLCAMFIGLMGGPLRIRTRFAILLGVGFCLTGLAAVLVDLVLGDISGHFFALWGLGWAWAFAIGLTVNGLSYFFGRFIAAPSMTIFIFLSIPSSGAAMPQWMMPEPFAWLNHVVVGSGISEMLKRLVYGVGPGYTRGWTMWAGYIVLGLVLTYIGRPYWEQKRVRQILSGRTTMFRDAQRANGRLNTKDEKQILAHYGLAERDDGALIHVDVFDGRSAAAAGQAEPDRQGEGRPENDRREREPEGRWDSTGVMDALEPDFLEGEERELLDDHVAAGRSRSAGQRPAPEDAAARDAVEDGPGEKTPDEKPHERPDTAD